MGFLLHLLTTGYDAVDGSPIPSILKSSPAFALKYLASPCRR
jgi:hypothetical protein